MNQPLISSHQAFQGRFSHLLSNSVYLYLDVTPILAALLAAGMGLAWRGTCSRTWFKHHTQTRSRKKAAHGRILGVTGGAERAIRRRRTDSGTGRT